LKRNGRLTLHFTTWRAHRAVVEKVARQKHINPRRIILKSTLVEALLRPSDPDPSGAKQPD
jgi:hypothetical protein